MDRADEEHARRKLPDGALRAGSPSVRIASFFTGSAEENITSNGWSVRVAGATENTLGFRYGRCAFRVRHAHVAGDNDQFGECRLSPRLFLT